MNHPMNKTGHPATAIRPRPMMLATGALMLAMLNGCVTINAPDKPIVINLNINITQEVVYRLDGEAKGVIQDNPGIF